MIICRPGNGSSVLSGDDDDDDPERTVVQLACFIDQNLINIFNMIQIAWMAEFGFLLNKQFPFSLNLKSLKDFS